MECEPAALSILFIASNAVAMAAVLDGSGNDTISGGNDTINCGNDTIDCGTGTRWRIRYQHHPAWRAADHVLNARVARSKVCQGGKLRYVGDYRTIASCWSTMTFEPDAKKLRRR